MMALGQQKVTPATASADRAGGSRALAMTLGLFIASFLVTRQTQVPALGGLAAPWSLLVAVLGLRWQRSMAWLLPMCAYGSLSLLASLMLGVEFANTIRFLLVTVGTLLAFHMAPAAISARLALVPLIMQSALIVAISLSLAVLQDIEAASAIRSMVLESNWGDIYSFDGLYYRVQLIGNALIPLLFLVSLWRWRQGLYYRVATAVALLGLVAAGNLTYVVVALVAILMRTWQIARRSLAARVMIGVVICAGLAVAGDIASDAFSKKFGANDSSMGVRFDQIDVAVSVWSESSSRFVFGSGLGSSFPDGRERAYSESQYIELQSLYLFVQLGVLGSAIYLATLAFSARECLNKDGQRIFWLYMLSGITNPYILDTNQIIAAMLLVCLFPRRTRVPTSPPTP
ncbi:hypothetical protein [Rhizobacter sp. SG703]|uniref:hypothetical protein n=1 Tax=Rhizobacter sp. SG703 TaxID=2587140 RepID=UPI001445B00C|nr:hypothetical protein [Rhizobacter sp. SG703]